MKHRATGIFIVILAALVVAPRASRQLVAFRDAAGSRLEATLWNAFLSLNGQHADSAAGRPFTPVQQSAPAETEVVARDRKAPEASAKPRENSRPEARRAVEWQGADAPERFIAKFENVENLFAIDPKSEGSVRFAVPQELPFDLERLLKSADKGASADQIAARVRAAENGALKAGFYVLPPQAVTQLQAAARRAPRARAAKDAKRQVVIKNEWERRGEDFEFNLFESDKPAPHHAAESHSRK